MRTLVANESLTVFVHAVDTTAHPSIPAGWRWAVHFGNDPRNLESILNAGWEPDEYHARIAGEAAAVVGVRVAMLLGAGDWRQPTVALPFDPCPPDSSGLDAITIL